MRDVASFFSLAFSGYSGCPYPAETIFTSSPCPPPPPPPTAPPPRRKTRFQHERWLASRPVGLSTPLHRRRSPTGKRRIGPAHTTSRTPSSTSLSTSPSTDG